MREIKFRAWDKERKEWQHFTLQELITGQATIIWPKLDDWCQFTGLKDRNGKEIYESDILKSTEKPSTGINGAFKVIFDEGAFSLEVEEDYWPYLCEAFPEQYCEVIGNIHENPDLVK